MASTATKCDSLWDEVVLDEAEFIALHLQGRAPRNRTVDITYDHGSALVTTSEPNVLTPFTRVLQMEEISELLGALRKLAQKTPRPRSVDSSALHSFVSTLARLVHSPGAVPFSTAYFGHIDHSDDGALVGELAFGPDLLGTIYDVSGQLYLDQHAAHQPKGCRRLLTIAQLRVLVAALQIRTGPANPASDPLWQQVLADATVKDESLKASGR